MADYSLGGDGSYGLQAPSDSFWSDSSAPSSDLYALFGSGGGEGLQLPSGISEGLQYDLGALNTDDLYSLLGSGGGEGLDYILNNLSSLNFDTAFDPGYDFSNFGRDVGLYVPESGAYGYNIGSYDYGLAPDSVSGEPGLQFSTATGPNLADMGGGQGLTGYAPQEYYPDGTPVQGTGALVTSSGAIPSGSSSQSLGSSQSFINNPAVTGKTAVGNGTVQSPSASATAPKAPTTAGTTQPTDKNNWMQALLMMLLMSQLGKGGGSSGGSSAVIPQLTASRSQTPYAQQRPAGYRPGQGGITYFNPTQYAAQGGVMGYAEGGGIGALGAYASGGKGRLVAGNGDGVSDDVPANIDGVQEARIARGEYVIPARVVAELGNGSTDAGAERLDEMVTKIENAGRKAARGTDSGAYKHLKV